MYSVQRTENKVLSLLLHCVSQGPNMQSVIFAVTAIMFSSNLSHCYCSCQGVYAGTGEEIVWSKELITTVTCLSGYCHCPSD